jgi:hypothetical protein
VSGSYQKGDTMLFGGMNIPFAYPDAGVERTNDIYVRNTYMSQLSYVYLTANDEVCHFFPGN